MVCEGRCVHAFGFCCQGNCLLVLHSCLHCECCSSPAVVAGWLILSSLSSQLAFSSNSLSLIAQLNKLISLATFCRYTSSFRLTLAHIRPIPASHLPVFYYTSRPGQRPTLSVLPSEFKVKHTFCRASACHGFNDEDIQYCVTDYHLTWDRWPD
ncbi:hypothetical protein BDZ45DRAFT_256248 [Acephala macrosclerotiorum]|nr:hypothetical protein BDZ45DRAFT_256248 [Acephala macrosclerotiorum]